jgi:hypothetical protein
VPIALKSGSLYFLEPSGLSRPVQGLLHLYNVQACSRVQCVPAALCLKLKRLERGGGGKNEAILYFHLVPRLRIFGNMPLFFHVVSLWRGVQSNTGIMFA